MDGWQLLDEFVGNTLYGRRDGGRSIRIEPPTVDVCTWTLDDEPITLPDLFDVIPPLYRQWAFDFTNAMVVVLAKQAQSELDAVGHTRLDAVDRAQDLLAAAQQLRVQAAQARDAFQLASMRS